MNNTVDLASEGAVLAAITGAARIWLGVNGAGNIAMFWTKSPDPADYPRLVIAGYSTAAAIREGGHAVAPSAAAPVVASADPILMAYVATDLDGHAAVAFTIDEAKRLAGPSCDTIIALHDISINYVELAGKPTNKPILAAPASPAAPVAPAFPPRDLTKPAEQQGLFEKFHVLRTDGSSAPGGKHHGCKYFVLDLDHDQHAPAAMRAYAGSCRATHPELAADIERRFAAPVAQPADLERLANEMEDAAQPYEGDLKDSITGWVEALRELAATPAAPLAQQSEPVAVGWFVNEGGAYIATSSDDPRGIKLYRYAGSAPASPVPKLSSLQRYTYDGAGEYTPAATGEAYLVEDVQTLFAAPASTGPCSDDTAKDAAMSERADQLNAALMRAATELPELYSIRVEIERGAGAVEWFDEDGNSHIIDSEESSLAEDVQAALDAALSAAEQGGKA